MRLARGAAALSFVATLGFATAVHAYCRTASCGDVVGAQCEPALPSDCGIPLYWPSSCVGYSLQKDASSQVDLDTVSALARQAFDTWQTATCEGGPPAITATDLGPVTCDQLEYNADAKNANVIIFRDESWPYTGAVLALTTVTYALDTGKIRDADMELNSAQSTFTTDDSTVDVDLLSILTHEAGHFLGLAHAPNGDATMNADYPPHSTSLRSLAEDDIAGICAAYPPGTEAACDDTPKNGLGDACETPVDPIDPEGCTVSRPPAPSGAGWLVLASLGWAASSRHRRR